MQGGRCRAGGTKSLRLIDMFRIPTAEFDLPSLILRNSLTGKSKSKKYGIVIDAAKCIDCKALIACKDENNVPTNH